MADSIHSMNETVLKIHEHWKKTIVSSSSSTTHSRFSHPPPLGDDLLPDQLSYIKSFIQAYPSLPLKQISIDWMPSCIRLLLQSRESILRLSDIKTLMEISILVNTRETDGKFEDNWRANLDIILGYLQTATNALFVPIRKDSLSYSFIDFDHFMHHHPLLALTNPGVEIGIHLRHLKILFKQLVFSALYYMMLPTKEPVIIHFFPFLGILMRIQENSMNNPQFSTTSARENEESISMSDFQLFSLQAILLLYSNYGSYLHSMNGQVLSRVEETTQAYLTLPVNEWNLELLLTVLELFRYIFPSAASALKKQCSSLLMTILDRVSSARLCYSDAHMNVATHSLHVDEYYHTAKPRKTEKPSSAIDKPNFTNSKNVTCLRSLENVLVVGLKTFQFISLSESVPVWFSGDSIFKIHSSLFLLLLSQNSPLKDQGPVIPLSDASLLQLMKTLLTLVTASSITQLQSSIPLLLSFCSMNIHSENIEMRQFCQEALGLLDVIIHPRRPLYLSFPMRLDTNIEQTQSSSSDVGLSSFITSNSEASIMNAVPSLVQKKTEQSEPIAAFSESPVSTSLTRQDFISPDEAIPPPLNHKKNESHNAEPVKAIQVDTSEENNSQDKLSVDGERLNLSFINDRLSFDQTQLAQSLNDVIGAGHADEDIMEYTIVTDDPDD